MTSPLSDSAAAAVDEIVETTQRAGRVSGRTRPAIVRNGTVIHAGHGGHRTGARHPVADRIHLQDVHRDAAASACGTPAGWNSTRRSPRTCPHCPSDRSPSGRCWPTSAACAGSRAVPGGSAPPAATSIRCWPTWTLSALIHRPQRLHHYSNLGYGLLGAVIEKVTGDTWWDALRTRIVEPLGMRRTSYFPIEPYATGYVVHPLRRDAARGTATRRRRDGTGRPALVHSG